MSAGTGYRGAVTSPTPSRYQGSGPESVYPAPGQVGPGPGGYSQVAGYGGYGGLPHYQMYPAAGEELSSFYLFMFGHYRPPILQSLSS